MSPRRILLIFQLAGESFALRLASIAEIIRLPDLAHMPLVPPEPAGPRQFARDCACLSSACGRCCSLPDIRKPMSRPV